MDVGTSSRMKKMSLKAIFVKKNVKEIRKGKDTCQKVKCVGIKACTKYRRYIGYLTSPKLKEHFSVC
ncbi:hypothetical protein LXL04_031272 [Taraxacum kok-saghyz]